MRKTLVDSKVGDVMIAMLVLLSFGTMIGAVLPLLYSVSLPLAELISIGLVEHELADLNMSWGYFFLLAPRAMKFGQGILMLNATWIASRWLFGAQPFRALRGRLQEIVRSAHV